MRKNRVILSVIYIVIGALICFIPTYLFPVCNSTEMKMSCYYTKQAEIGLGLLIILLGIVSIGIKNSSIRVGISLALAGTALLVLLYPIKLIGLCKKSHMACRIGTFPALSIAGIGLLIISIWNIWYLLRKDKENGRK